MKSLLFLALITLSLVYFAPISTLQKNFRSDVKLLDQDDSWYNIKDIVPPSLEDDNQAEHQDQKDTIYQDESHVTHTVKVQPTDQPTQPTDQPTQPTDQPTQPTDQPTQPTKPTKPTQPTQPTQPTKTQPTFDDSWNNPVYDHAEKIASAICQQLEFILGISCTSQTKDIVPLSLEDDNLQQSSDVIYQDESHVTHTVSVYTIPSL